MKITGGYYLLNRPFVRSSIHKHTAWHLGGISQRALDAVNIIQSTPWRINRQVCDLMNTAWVEGIEQVLPPSDPMPLPDRMSEEEWEAMPESRRSEIKRARRMVYEANAEAEGHRVAFLSALHTAQRYADQEAIWFPHNIDFRGRIYPIPEGLNPQSDKTIRAMLHFAEGKRLGASGLYWLAIRLANTAGKDKLSFDERIKWVVDNEALILDSARDPLDGQRFWFSADEPWEFLATCFEWEMAQRLSNPEDHVSHLAVNLDGTVNGLQHLSLMGRDPVGALATNCSAAPERNDLYMVVAERVKAAVARDAAAGLDVAQRWIGQVTRDVVKRGVMTTPYGVTFRGMRTQLFQDGHCKSLGGSIPDNTRYMATKIIEAMDSTVSSARSIMTWFQESAKALAEVNLPLQWRTPVGCELTQAYLGLSECNVRTLIGSMRLWRENEQMGIEPRKQALASAPNIIHSYDAAMLMETVLRTNERGCSAYAMIHDSYGTHAADTEIMAETLRQVAYDIYKEDQLALIEDHIRRYAPNVELPERPPLGDFDPSEVLRSPYFFS